jgi:Domain of unknown function (DUF6933)
MRIIHCTKNLLKELDVPLVEPDKIPSNAEGLGNWYANLIGIDRRRCLLFTNEKTLYTFLIPKVLKGNLKNIENEFFTHLTYNLQNEGFGLEVVSIQQEYKEIGFAETSNKKVLGLLNEFAFEYEFIIMRKEGLENVNILEINRQINRTIKVAIHYQHPIEALKKVLQGANPIIS